MARIRTIKPDAFKSDTLSQIPRGVRWTFAGLWTYLDDDGYGRDNVRLIKAALYPLDEEITADVIADDLKQLEAIGSICRFETDGKAYLHVPKSPDKGWDHQKINRPTPTKFPLCREHSVTAHCALTECSCEHGESVLSAGQSANCQRSLSAHGALSEHSLPDREQGTGNKEQGVSADESFAEFWSTYPRKTDKGNAKKCWVKALKKKPAAEIIAAAAAYAATKPDPKFTAHPSTWLNGERWDDELARAPAEPPQRVYLPETPPEDIDPDDTEAYAAAMRRAANG